MTNQPAKGPYRVEDYVGDNGGPVTDIVDAEGHRIAECFDLPTAQLLADSWQMLKILKLEDEGTCDKGCHPYAPDGHSRECERREIEIRNARSALLAKYEVEK